MTPALAVAPLAVHRSRKLIPEFRLHRPRTPAEAVALKAAAGAGSVYMAGGIDVVNRMKFGVPVTDLIHLGGIPGLDGIAEAEGGLRLGALVTHDRLATSQLVQRQLPDVAQTWPDVANIRIRCKGTIGGNIMAGDPGYDFALAAMAADAQLHFLTCSGETRVVSATDWNGATSDQLLTAVVLPFGSAFRVMFDRSLRPIVTLAIGLEVCEDRITGGRVAIGCGYPRPMGAPLPFQESLTVRELGRCAARFAHELAVELPEPLADHNAGASYRRRMIEVLLRRNLSALA